MRAMVCGVVAACVIGMPVAAQTTTRKLAWEQSDAGTVAAAQALIYTLTVDAKPPVVIAQTCAQTAPPVITCTAPLTALGAGKHTLTLQVDNGFDSAVATLSGASPAVPNNLKISITITVP